MKTSFALYLLPLVAASPFTGPAKALQARDIVCTSYGCGYKPTTIGTATAATGQQYTVYSASYWNSGISRISRTFGTTRQSCVDLCGKAAGCAYWTQFVGSNGAPYCEIFQAASTPTAPTCQDSSADFESGKLN